MIYHELDTGSGPAAITTGADGSGGGEMIVNYGALWYHFPGSETDVTAAVEVAGTHWLPSPDNYPNNSTILNLTGSYLLLPAGVLRIDGGAGIDYTGITPMELEGTVYLNGGAIRSNSGVLLQGGTLIATGRLFIYFPFLAGFIDGNLGVEGGTVNITDGELMLSGNYSQDMNSALNLNTDFLDTDGVHDDALLSAGGDVDVSGNVVVNGTIYPDTNADHYFFALIGSSDGAVSVSANVTLNINAPPGYGVTYGYDPTYPTDWGIFQDRVG